MNSLNSYSSSPTAIVCQIASATRVYDIKIAGYSMCKGIGASKYIECHTFTLDGHRWAVNFYPNKVYSNYSFVEFDLKLLSEVMESIGVFVAFSILNLNGGTSSLATKSGTYTYNCKGDTHGPNDFVKSYDLEALRYIKDDCLMLRCTVRIIKPTHKEVGKESSVVVVPSSDLHLHFGSLLESGEGADVMFKVEGETFLAHRIVLAARSPVFRAELVGSMLESKMQCIKIEGMKAAVFKVLLRFIYTDLLPDHGDDEKDDSSEMFQHLFVAADKYGLERLRLICVDKLCANISVDTASTTLALAEQHNCQLLKDVCVDYIASSEMLHAVLATDGFKHLMVSCPMILKELLEKVDLRK